MDRRLCDDFWDLRDDAYDHADRWQGISAEAIFQRLAQLVEDAEERGAIDWHGVTRALIAWRATEEPGQS
jgi:hypothetical protein